MTGESSMATTSPKFPMGSPRPVLCRGKASENLSPLTSSPSKSPKPSPSQRSKGGIASPKVKPVKNFRARGLWRFRPKLIV